MKSYLLLILAAILFSSQSIFTKKYQNNLGVNLKSAFILNTLSPIGFVVIMLCIQKFNIIFTPYTLVMSFIWAILSVLIAYFSIKCLALGSICNYTVFLLGGGMIIPIFYGIIFNNERVNLLKIIGIIFILLATVFQFDFKEKVKKAYIINFLCLFFINGLISITSAIYQGNIFSFEKTSEQQFSILRGLMTILIGIICLSIINIKKEKQYNIVTKRMYLYGFIHAIINGIMNGLGNLLLLFALLDIEASLQFPFITGGCIVISALVGRVVFKEKINKNTFFSILLAFSGTIFTIL